MSPEAWFQVVNTFALTGWLALALSPVAPRLLGLLGGTAMPLLLSGGYTAIVLWKVSTQVYGARVGDA